jgi:hypothetical protein
VPAHSKSSDHDLNVTSRWFAPNSPCPGDPAPVGSAEDGWLTAGENIDYSDDLGLLYAAAADAGRAYLIDPIGGSILKVEPN